MQSFSTFTRHLFGEKVYKLALNGGMTCPNRDGRLSTLGCIFCSSGGSGEFASEAGQPIGEQIEAAKQLVGAKFHGNHYVAYLQPFTNTYAPLDYLTDLYESILKRDDIVCLDIATRPDCISDDVLALLARLNQEKPIWVELGLQTSSDKTARLINRGYPTEVYQSVVSRLRHAGIHTVTHVIFGLPGEGPVEMMDTVRMVAGCHGDGIKLQVLQVLRGTVLAELYQKGEYRPLTYEEYRDEVIKAVRLCPDDMVLHRMTGDPPKQLLLAPAWCADKKRVLGGLQQALKDNHITIR